MTFTDLLKARGGAAPLRVVALPASAWAPGWTDRPEGASRIGLRLLSEREVQNAVARAQKLAAAAPGDLDAQVEVYNAALVRLAVAWGTCNPIDATEPFLPMAEDTVGDAFTSDGIRRLYEELVALTFEHSPLAYAANDADIAELPELLAAAPDGVARRLRRLIGAAVRELATETPLRRR